MTILEKYKKIFIRFIKENNAYIVFKICKSNTDFNWDEHIINRSPTYMIADILINGKGHGIKREATTKLIDDWLALIRKDIINDMIEVLSYIYNNKVFTNDKFILNNINILNKLKNSLSKDENYQLTVDEHFLTVSFLMIGDNNNNVFKDYFLKSFYYYECKH